MDRGLLFPRRAGQIVRRRRNRADPFRCDEPVEQHAEERNEDDHDDPCELRDRIVVGTPENKREV